MTATLSASELVCQLQALIKQHGDLPVYIWSEGTVISFYVGTGEVTTGEAWFSTGETVAKAVLIRFWRGE